MTGLRLPRGNRKRNGRESLRDATSWQALSSTLPICQYDLETHFDVRLPA